MIKKVRPQPHFFESMSLSQASPSNSSSAANDMTANQTSYFMIFPLVL